MLVLQVASLVLVAMGATAVILTRNPLRQSLSMSLYGLLLTLMFFLFQAPDVALAQIAVGAVALPLMILLALSKVKQNERDAAYARQRDEKASQGERRDKPSSRKGQE